MKATGIVRRMDELGRVVIPKEIRRTLRIREGDPLEIFTDRDELMLKKYSPIATIEKFSESAAKTLAELSGKTAVVCDTDGVLFAVADGGTLIPITVPGDTNFSAQIVVPVVSGGDCLGAVALLCKEAGARVEADEVKLVRLTAGILANQFE